MNYRLINILTLFFVSQSIFAGANLRIFGYIIDTNNHGIDQAVVTVENSNSSTVTNPNGYYEIVTSLKDSIRLTYSMVGYSTVKHCVVTNKHVVQISVQLQSTDRHLTEINVVGQRRRMTSLDALDPSKYRLMPNASGGIESFLINFSGVSSNNELSSQYNVRGGNFDENAVYVNGIEVYRPLLVRSGQQEGLSFVNPDMVDNLNFSSGGYDAKYGDKMSSVLDIEYKKPTKFESSLSLSLLGGSAYVGTSKRNFTQMHGVRYKTSKYLLGTLDTKAEYAPSFFDYQTYLTWKLNSKLELTFLGNLSQNNYSFIPQTRSTSFGTYSTGRNLTVYFDGQESDLFRTYFGAFSLNYTPQSNVKLSLIASAFNTNENETYDIKGEYILSEVDMGSSSSTDANSSSSDNSDAVLGIGKYMQHARNTLKATVVNLMHQGAVDVEKHKIKWGFTLQGEKIKDKISEWEVRDSAGYSLPASSSQMNVYYNLKANNQLNTFRAMGYLQDTYKWNFEKGILQLTAGIRANYWTFNHETLLSPRFSLGYIPQWQKEYCFRLSTGIYYQAPFYKEFRQVVTDSLGNARVHLNNNIKAQRSFHLVLGADHYFRAWGRPFKLTAESYLKMADRVISYQIDNVQIRYSGLNDAKAYTAGVDFKLFGEFVPGADSWINLSLMNSKENIQGDSYVNKTYDSSGNVVSSQTIYPGYFSRPNEQRYVLSMMFQDYWITNPKYKVHLKAIISDGMPLAAPKYSDLTTLFRAKQLRSSAYRRLDIGVSRVLKSESDQFMKHQWMKHIRCIWLNAEIFNLMDFKNVNSYYWVSDVSNQQWAVPNYLTGRQLNLRVIVDLK